MKYPIGKNETARLSALHSLSVLDTARESVFDSIVELARDRFEVPICLISLVDKDRQWFKAECGLGIEGTPRELAFCNYTIVSNRPLIVEDAASDARFANNALVTGAPFIRFYAGVPLMVADGLNVGSFCIIDQRPRTLNDTEISHLTSIASIVVRLLQQSRNIERMELLTQELRAGRAVLARRNGDLRMMSSLAKIGEWSLDLASQQVFWSSEVRRIHEVGDDYQPTLEGAVDFYPESVRQKLKDGLNGCIATRQPWDTELPFVTAKGNSCWVRVYATAFEEDGNVTKLVGAFQDVTEAVEAREELTALGKRLELAAESASIGLWEWSVSNGGHFWNHPAWWHYLGFEHAPVARPDADADTFIHPDDLPAVLVNRKAFVTSRSAQLVNEFRHLDGSGAWRWVSSIGRGTKFDSAGNMISAAGVYIDIHERKLADERVRYTACHDTMTGLVNRAEVKRLYNEMTQSTRPDANRLSIIVVDLDRFKHVNDTFGHAAGDAVLTNIANRLRRLVRHDDIVARLGGDEFAIVLGGGDGSRARSATIAERIVSELSAPIEFEGRNLQVGASVGIALAPGHGEDFDTLIRNADAALYKIKLNGRNAYRFFDDTIAAEAEASRGLEDDLRNALARGELTLHFQPQIRFSTGEVTAVEALLRWHHPVRGMIGPDQFMSIAEESGLIVPIGKWAIEQACIIAAQWDKPLILSVNISPTQFGKKNLLHIVSNALSSSKLPPHRLEIELTESVLVKNDDEQLADLRKLHDLGVRLALDHFGIGYASLGYLRKLPLNKIKIDKSFISDIMTNVHSAAIVRAVANLANSLGIETTAEGIETEGQATLVRASACTNGQGYFIGHPVPSRNLFVNHHPIASEKFLGRR